MKTMTCKQLGGACDVEFKAETFDEIAQLSQQHGNEMFQKEDEAHLNAMNKMQKMMQAPNGMQEWMDKKRNEFNSI
ncbi:MAG: DUF1059 domain-containing protein [Candidatus Marinimicrobia bacterium]|jgi:hypothetical protein|nr:DUF1059 domain-containing protein [Candidatus Neomarinimicrobiota bacterium]MBT5955717.1 DUF1059 domain-containing protein [Candidatus Neomarinimicrobiota bacterium]